MSKKYIHYGSSEFIPEAFREIKNECFTKPMGGLWASAKDADFGWKAWCKREDFCLSELEYSFEFELSPEARIFEITPENIEDLPKNKELFDGTSSTFFKFLDFEQIKEKYDVIIHDISKHPCLYWLLYGWDCDCILVLNKEVIVV
jgi:hypothetical protein